MYSQAVVNPQIMYMLPTPSAPPYQPQPSQPAQPVSTIQPTPFVYPTEITVHLKQHLSPQFSSGLCDCCLDISGCIYGCICPCHLFGKNVENLTNQGCCKACCCYLCCCGSCNHAPMRRKLRMKYGLLEEPCNDCCVAVFCSCCALCQEHREIMHQMWSKGPVRATMH
jgi:Cys-rich protein (TIGR01571 family)